MKCLSIQQPWAAMICGAVQDVENRSWKPKTNPGRILIHAGLRRRDFKDDLYTNLIIENAINHGYVDYINEQPLGAIIGYADVDKIVEHFDSYWASEGDGAEYKWVLKNARLFKTPIPAAGKRQVYDVPEISEDNLPEAYDFPRMKRNGTTLEVPLSQDFFDSLANEDNNYVWFNLVSNNLDFFVDENFKELPTDKVIFINSRTGERREFSGCKVAVMPQADEETGHPILLPSTDGNEVQIYSANIIYR